MCIVFRAIYLVWLETPMGVCMWCMWGWEFGGRIEMRDNLIYISLYNWEIFSDDSQ